MVQPGDHATASRLIQPIAMGRGLTFAVREAATVGSGRVTKIIE